MTDARAAQDALEIGRLASLSALEYDREREEAAKKLGCRVMTLDQQVARYRGDEASVGNGQSPRLKLPEPEPWHEPVNGAELLDTINREIQRYVVLSGANADAVALWVVASHAFDRFDIFPRLFITAPEKGCGKSTLLDVLERLVNRPLAASNIRAAALFRTIEVAQPTFLLDEADAYVPRDEDLRSVIDSGHHRRGSAIRCVGDDNQPTPFSTFCPMVLAGIGRLPGTIEDRSIKIGMRRSRRDEHVTSLRCDRSGNLDELARRTARWAKDNLEALADADPQMPVGIYNRPADNWRPLISVADLAGSNWPERARKAAVSLWSEDGENSDSARVLLLGDLRDLFSREATGVLSSRDILSALHDDETRPWSEWKNGRPITAVQVSALLREFKIKPKTVRRGSETDKGYKLEWFEDAFERYLPPRSVTSSHPSVSAAIKPIPAVTVAALPIDVTEDDLERTSASAACDDVTDLSRILWRETV